MCLCVFFYPVSGVEQGGRKRERIRSKRERELSVKEPDE